MKKKTDKNKTLLTLAGHYIENSHGKPTINIEYLNNDLITFIDNTWTLYDAMINTKRKPEAIAWQAFAELAGTYINYEYGEKDILYYAASNHLKIFLELHGSGYQTIAPTIEHIKKERKYSEKEIDRLFGKGSK